MYLVRGAEAALMSRDDEEQRDEEAGESGLVETNVTPHTRSVAPQAQSDDERG